MVQDLRMMKIEKEILGSKLKRLNDSIDEQAVLPYDMRKIDQVEYNLLSKQAKAMEEYYITLCERIKYDEEKKKNARK